MQQRSLAGLTAGMLQVKVGVFTPKPQQHPELLSLSFNNYGSYKTFDTMAMSLIVVKCCKDLVHFSIQYIADHNNQQSVFSEW